MPEFTYTYTRADLLFWTELTNDINWIGTEGTGSFSSPEDGLISGSFNGSVEDSTSSDFLSSANGVVAQLIYTGQIDLEAPGKVIPADAIIKNIVFRVVSELAAEAETSTSTIGTGDESDGCSDSSRATASCVATVGFLSLIINEDESALMDDFGTSFGAIATSSYDETENLDFLSPYTELDLNLSLLDFISAGYDLVGGQIDFSAGVQGEASFSIGASGLSEIQGAWAGHADITDWEYSITFESDDPDTPLVEETMVDPSGFVLGGFGDASDVVLIVDISGIYKLVPNKRDDTWYDRTDPEAVDTIDVKIPDPFVSLAFLPKD